jgi:16S rRNA (cytosine967-C5)-methyltransferase
LNLSTDRTEGLEVRWTAYRILRRVDETGSFASLLLDRYESRFSDPRDRALLHETVLGVLRHRAWIDHVIDAASSRPPDRIDPPVRDVLRIGAHAILRLNRVPEFAAVHTSVEIAKRVRRAAAGFVNGVLRGVASRGLALAPPEPKPGDLRGLAVRRSHPEWWVRRAVERAGWQDAVALMEANNRPAPTSVRLRTGRTTAEALIARLAEEGVKVEPSPWVPDALRVLSGVAHRTRSFADGLFYVQDEASQLVVRLFGEIEGRRAADLCAAPGGKTMQLAEALPAGGTVVASDRHEGRLRRLVANASRLGYSGIAGVVADVSRDTPFPAGCFDHVLLDAPCSGTGTLRRHPEIRWRLTPEDLARLAAVQRRLLANAARLVRPGGTLVYSVCSLEPEEGSALLDSFLRGSAEFTLVPAANRLPPSCTRFARPDGTLTTSPVDGLDGFYAALVRRTP